MILASTMRPLLGLLAAASAASWVLPGTGPVNFPDGAVVSVHLRSYLSRRSDYSHVVIVPSHAFVQIPLKVNKLTSTKTQLGYENYKLPFCRVSRPSRRRTLLRATSLPDLQRLCSSSFSCSLILVWRMQQRTWASTLPVTRSKTAPTR